MKERQDLQMVINHAHVILGNLRQAERLYRNEPEALERVKARIRGWEAAIKLLDGKTNVKDHTPDTGGAASRQIEGCRDKTKSDSERVADCGATPCSPVDFLGRGSSDMGQSVPSDLVGFEELATREPSELLALVSRDRVAAALRRELGMVDHKPHNEGSTG